jgi:glycosyltransferase involved in cell wall biosynthesis
MTEQKQLRILHVIGSLDPGGVETWLLNVLKYIDRDLFQFHFCTFGPRPGLYSKQVERLGGRVFRCPKGLDLWSLRRAFQKILCEGSYDAVHSHVYFFSGVLLRWAHEVGIPIRIAHSHVSRDNKPNTQVRRFYRSLMKFWIYRYATCGLAASKPAAVELFGQHWQVDYRFRVLHCGIDLSAFHVPIDRNAVRKEIGLPTDAPIIGHVANFVPVKNHAFILEIANEILKIRPEIHFLFVGDGPLRLRVQAEAAAKGISNRMHFVGTRTDVPRLMRAAMDLYIFPSMNEGFGLTLLEAQAAGLACLVSDTVPHEVSRLPGYIKFIPLSAGMNHWAEKIITELDVPRSQGVLVPNDSTRISIQQSVCDLTSIYLASQMRSIPIAVQQHA